MLLFISKINSLSNNISIIINIINIIIIIISSSSI